MIHHNSCTCLVLPINQLAIDSIDHNKPKVSVRSVSWTTSLIRWLVSGPLKLEVSQLLKTGTITTSTSLVNGRQVVVVVSTLQDLALRLLDYSKLTVHLDWMGEKTPISSGFNILISILDLRDAGSGGELQWTNRWFSSKSAHNLRECLNSGWGSTTLPETNIDGLSDLNCEQLQKVSQLPNQKE